MKGGTEVVLRDYAGLEKGVVKGSMECSGWEGRTGVEKRVKHATR